jgi:hypothetical protein
VSTVEKPPVIDPQIQADQEAAERHFLEGTPFEPDLARRIRARSERMMGETSRRVGFIDVDKFIHETRDGV